MEEVKGSRVKEDDEEESLKGRRSRSNTWSRSFRSDCDLVGFVAAASSLTLFFALFVTRAREESEREI